jgi:hypothetical protein
MTRLVQLKHPKEGRRVAVVQDAQLKLLRGTGSIYNLANAAIASGKSLAEIVSKTLSAEALGYDSIYRGASDWRLLPAFDHPEEPARCLVTGTGLTHQASARNRQAMHAGGKKRAAVTDSMRMYQWGLAGGRPARGKIGPELIVGVKFDDVPGTVRIERKGKVIWTKQIFTGENNLSHTLANLEHHHFKHPAHRRPGDAHIHFFGADAFSFGDGLALRNGDTMEIELAGFGRPLRNPIRMDRTVPRLVLVAAL